jgi:hypothetical protein
VPVTRLLAPRTLLALGIVFLAVAIVLAIFVRHGRKHAAAPPTVSTSPVPVQPPPPSGPSVTTLSSFSATVTGAHDGLVRWGPAGAQPVLWTRAADGVATITGLAARTRYVADVGTESLGFTTAAAPAQASGSVADGEVKVNGAPFFPLIAWQQCPDQWLPNLRQGITLFAGNPCTDLGSLLTWVSGKALAAGTSDDTATTSGPGLIGWFYPDEADGRGIDAASLPAPPAAGVRFLTITGHFYSRSAPLPGGRGMYPGLIAAADVVGFDLYPLQEWCRPDRLAEVFDAQRELVALAQGKPTFQWIEVRQMKCPQVQVTPATIRAESWLAIAGGAHGLGFFPNDWGAQVGETIHRIARRVQQLEPALLQPAISVEVAGASSMRASVRELNGALYVIAVNGGSTPAVATLAAPQLSDRTFDVLGAASQVTAENGVLTDRIPPLGVRIYVAPPAG